MEHSERLVCTVEVRRCNRSAPNSHARPGPRSFFCSFDPRAWLRADMVSNMAHLSSSASSAVCMESKSADGQFHLRVAELVVAGSSRPAPFCSSGIRAPLVWCSSVAACLRASLVPMRPCRMCQRCALCSQPPFLHLGCFASRSHLVHDVALGCVDVADVKAGLAHAGSAIPLDAWERTSPDPA